MANVRLNYEYNILVVDDSRSDRELFKHMLENEGYCVETAKDGKEALGLLEKGRYDLVLCDYYMPVLDGYWFLQEVKRHPDHENMIVIIITSDEDKETKVRLLNAGADDFVYKGASREELLARVGTHLRAKEITSLASVVKMAYTLAEQIEGPLMSFSAVLDSFKEKLERDVEPSKRTSFAVLRRALDLQANNIQQVAKSIRKIGDDVSRQYRL